MTTTTYDLSEPMLSHNSTSGFKMPQLAGYAATTATAAAWITTALVASLTPSAKTPWANPWVDLLDFPVSNVTWDNLTGFQRPAHPTMQSQEVKKFQLALLDADMDALRDIFDIVQLSFSDVPGMSWSYRESRDHDTLEPQLFLRVDTHGMDLDEQMKRELVMREAIASAPRLVAAKQYHVITIV